MEFRFNLEVITPLHIGSGFPSKRKAPHAELSTVPGAPKQPVGEAEVADVIRDKDGRPCIPGAPVKGVLLRRARETLTTDILASFFGEGPSGGTGGRGGQLQFTAAYLETVGVVTNAHQNDDEPATELLRRHARSRVRGAPADKKLFFSEVVLPGTTFKGCIRGQQLSQTAVVAFHGLFAGIGTLELGAMEENGFGQVQLKDINVAVLTKDALVKWLDSTQKGRPTLAPMTIPEAQIKVQQTPAANRVVVPLRMKQEGLLLVGSVTRTGEQYQGGTCNEWIEPQKRADGRIVLPASSIRGALRDRGEWLLQKLYELRLKNKQLPDSSRPLYSDPTAAQVEALHDPAKPDELSISSAIFGAGGWRTPVRIEDWVAVANATTKERTRTQVDRVTGAALDNHLFKQIYVENAVYTGEVSFDVARWKTAGVLDVAGPLWALLIDELQNGDLLLGHGVSNSHGKVVKAPDAPGQPKELEDWRKSPVYEELKKACKAAEERRLRLDVTLRIDGPLLVRVGPGQPGQPPQPVLLGDRAVIPASSFRGVLRSAGERYLRSGWAGIANAGSRKPIVGEPGEAIKDDNELPGLSLAGAIFGAGGWRSPWRISDFVSAETANLGEQPRLAIDRLTQANANLFSSRFVWKPVLKGRIEIDLDAWDAARVESDGLALLRRLKADFEAGRLTFGGLAGIGYGRCCATVVGCPVAQKLLGAIDSRMPLEPAVALRPVSATGDPGTSNTIGTDWHSCAVELGKLQATNAGKVPNRRTPAGKAYDFIPVNKPAIDKDGWIEGRMPKFTEVAGHDKWTQDRLAGRILCRITTENAVIVAGGAGPKRGNRGPVVRTPFVDVSGNRCIAGSTLRGLLSDLHEKATNSAYRILKPNGYDIHGELIPWCEHRELISPSEVLFGAATQGQRTELAAWAGKIHVGWAKQIPGSNVVNGPEKQAYLAAPHAENCVDGQWRPLGKKAYLHESPNDIPVLPNTTANCLPKGTQFEFNIDFSDLSEAELGSLLYVLRPCDGFRHKLGLGKGQNWGRIQIDIKRIDAWRWGSGPSSRTRQDLLTAFFSSTPGCVSQRAAIEAWGVPPHPGFRQEIREPAPAAVVALTPPPPRLRERIQKGTDHTFRYTGDDSKGRPNFTLLEDPKCVGLFEKPKEWKPGPRVGETLRLRVTAEETTTGPLKLAYIS